MVYRADIDGLRGFAVLLVVVFHSGLPIFSGGFVGVDIFFVISGYLITSIILNDVKKGQFSYIGFYERRIRRILPAFYVMSAVVLVVAALIQMPLDFLKSAKSLLFAIFFSSNMFFWRTTNYFSSSSDFDFFLHTWSLGVEEQFYFVFPLVILLFFKRGNWFSVLVVLAWFISFAFSVYTSYFHEWASYYLLPSRAWQLMTGSVLAIFALRPINNNKLIFVLSVFALLLLLIPALLYAKDTRFPGVAALWPTIGAALVIFLGIVSENSWLTRLMAWSPLRFVGLISYSLYLWHWPVFAFLRHYQADTRLSVELSVFGIFVSFVMAYFSWRFVEAFFRDKSRLSRVLIYRIAGISSAALIGLCILIMSFDGMPSRIDPKVIQLSQVSESGVIDNPCVNKSVDDVKHGDVCHVGVNDNQAPVVAFWGDSHLGALRSTFDLALNEDSKRGVFLGKTGCPPLLGVLKSNLSDGESCLQFNQAAYEYIAKLPSVETVVLHARWALSAEGTRYGSEKGPSYILKDTHNNTGGALSANAAVVEMGIIRTVEALQNLGKQVVVIASVPEVGSSVPRVLANNMFWGKDKDIRPSVKDFLRRQVAVDVMLKRLQDNYRGVQVVYPYEYLCSEKFCNIERNGEPLYFDDDHVSNLGASLIVEEVKQYF